MQEVCSSTLFSCLCFSNLLFLLCYLYGMDDFEMLLLLIMDNRPSSMLRIVHPCPGRAIVTRALDRARRIQELW